jgi:TonB family protein
MSRFALPSVLSLGVALASGTPALAGGSGALGAADQVVVNAPQPPAATIVVPGDQNALGLWASVWPETAYRARISGRVMLSCGIDRFGHADWCKVASETPPKLGFGAAALELRPTFKLTPAMGPDGPVDPVETIAVEFKAPDPRLDFGTTRESGPTSEQAGIARRAETADINVFGDPVPRRSITMLNNPVWASTVSYADLARAYPAKAGGVAGYAAAHCEVSRTGALSGCQLIAEDPPRKGFGQAAVSLASTFKVSPEWATAPGHADLWVDVPVRFPASGAAESRTVDAPYWVAGFDPSQALKLFPPEAADKGITSGEGYAKCVVAVDGSLTQCAPDAGDSDGLGFSQAAAKLVSTMRMNPWTSDGAPVDGAVVRIGVKLNLKR